MSERKRKTKPRETPHPVDVTAGRNLLIARTLAGYTQQRLGDAVGLSFQQIQKYENGRNRMSLSRAWQFSKILGIDFSALIDGADDAPADSSLPGPRYGEWIALYAKARETGRLREIIGIAGSIVEICELAARESSQCR